MVVLDKVLKDGTVAVVGPVDVPPGVLPDVVELGSSDVIVKSKIDSKYDSNAAKLLSVLSIIAVTNDPELDDELEELEELEELVFEVSDVMVEWFSWSTSS